MFETGKFTPLTAPPGSTFDRRAPVGSPGPTSGDHNGRVVAGPRISVIVPTLNEAQNLPYVFAKLPRGIFEVLVVDGFSTDDTTKVALQLRRDVRVIRQHRRGKGNALACGFANARGDVIVTLDADGSADPAEIGAFVQALEDGADFAKGSRFRDGGGSHDITRSRRAGNWVLSRLVNLLFGTGYTDLCYGYNAFWTRCLPAIGADCDGFEVETMLNIRIKRAGLKVVEVPSFERQRIHGESKLSILRDGLRVLRTIIRERLRLRAPAGATDGAVQRVVDSSEAELKAA